MVKKTDAAGFPCRMKKYTSKSSNSGCSMKHVQGLVVQDRHPVVEDDAKPHGLENTVQPD